MFLDIYNQEEILKYIDNIIVMLYLKDAGFYTADNELNLILKDSRIKNLRDYYQNKCYQTAVSLEGGIFLERNDGHLIKINKEDRLHFLKIKADALLNQGDYIWEYFQLQQ